MWSNKQSDVEDGEIVEEGFPGVPGESDTENADQPIDAQSELEPEDGELDELDALNELNELEELRDRHLRLVAEFENFRKRTRREQAELRPAAQAELAKKLLPTLDDLARVSEIPHESTTVKALDAGVELILRNLKKELEESGLTPIEAVGQVFDPTFHEGILIAETDDPELDHTVSRVLVQGYQFAGRLVRPAQVEIYQYSEPSTETLDD